MRKALLPILFILALLLSACGSSQTQSTTAVSPTTAVLPTPTVAPYTDEKTPCKSLNILDFMLYSVKIKLPDVKPDEWIDGSINAPITLYLYDDLQCPYCARFDPIFHGVVNEYPNDVRLVYRHWPLTSIHPNAVPAAIAAEAAGKQGKFFVMTDFLFANQAEWSGKSPADFTSWVNEKAALLGLDATQFASDLKDDAIIKKVNDDTKASDTLFEQLSVTMPEAGGFGTPTLFIDNYLYREDMSINAISFFINLIKFNKINKYECPAMEIDQNKDYTAKITTTKGDILVDLLEKEAPVSVNSFVNLARKGWFTDNVFFTNEQFTLSGDKSNTGYGNAGYAFLDEISTKYNFDKEGMLALPNFLPGTNNSQFFINKIGISAMNGRYTIFGVVTQGMDVVKSLISYDKSMPLDKADKIVSITISPE